MSVVLKLQCDDGEIFRLMLAGPITHEAVLEAVSSARPGPCSLKYADDEEDLCTLLPTTFADFLSVHGYPAKAVLKLRLFSTARGTAPEKQPVPEKGYESPNGAPPGLEEEFCATRCAGMFGGSQCLGGPRKLLAVLRMMRASGALTPLIFASLAVQWLPLLTQRVARKVDKINHMAKDGAESTLRRIMEGIRDISRDTEGLEKQEQALSKALAVKPGSQQCLGEALLELLKSLRQLSFQVQASFAERVGELIMPVLDELAHPWCQGNAGKDGKEEDGTNDEVPLHHGITCDGCLAIPIQGPRFKCTVCADFDLCGNCYTRKLELHGNCAGALKDFTCVLLPGLAVGSKKSGAMAAAATAAGKKWQNVRTLVRGKVWSKGCGKGKGLLSALLEEGATPQGEEDASSLNPQALPFAPSPGLPWSWPPGNSHFEVSMWSDHLAAMAASAMSSFSGIGAKGDGRGFCEAASLERKLATLRDLGLSSEEANLEALLSNGGDVSKAARLLLGD